MVNSFNVIILYLVRKTFDFILLDIQRFRIQIEDIKFYDYFPIS